MSSDTQNPYGASGAAPAPTATMQQGRTVTLRRLDVLSVGKMLGVLYALIGVIIGAVMVVAGLVGAAAGGGPEGAIGGVVVAVLMPIFYGAAGFIGGLLLAVFYNLCANLIGGVTFDLEG